MVVLDLQKAFDTVNPQILINKLKELGLNQSKSLILQAHISKRVNITCSVPQGSILELLLFLIYVYGIKAEVKCKLILYADNSALLVSGKDVVKIEQVLI